VKAKVQMRECENCFKNFKDLKLPGNHRVRTKLKGTRVNEELLHFTNPWAKCVMH